MMIGEACPLPLIGVFQTRFSGNFQSTGAFGSLTVPSPNAPLHAGQSSAEADGVDPMRANMEQARTRNLFIRSSCGLNPHLRVKTHPGPKSNFRGGEDSDPSDKINAEARVVYPTGLPHLACSVRSPGW